MIPDYISGSDIADKVGWNQDTMLILFTRFITSNQLEDNWLDFLNNLAEQEQSEFDEET